MSDVYEHNPDDHEDPLTGPTLMVGGLGAVALVAILLVLTALYYNAKADEVEEQVVLQERREVRDLHDEQAQVLQVAGQWVDRDDGGQTIRAYIIPIDRAMELIVEEADR